MDIKYRVDQKKFTTFTMSSGISQQMKTTFCKSRTFFLVHPVFYLSSMYIQYIIFYSKVQANITCLHIKIEHLFLQRQLNKTALQSFLRYLVIKHRTTPLHQAKLSLPKAQVKLLLLWIHDSLCPQSSIWHSK